MSFKSLQGNCARKLSIWHGLLVVSMLVISCDKETVERDYPRVRTLEVTNITEAGVTFRAEVFEKGRFPITEHGFTWSFFKPDLRNSEKVVLGPFEGTGIFSADIMTALEKDLIYSVCAYVKAGDYTVYGEEVKFTSLGSTGPLITGFSPERAYCGDTILVWGRNYSYVNTKAYIENIPVEIIHPASDTLLKIAVPYSLTTSENVISVNVTDKLTSFTTKKLIVDLPYIDTVISESVFWGDTVCLRFGNMRYLTGNDVVSVFLDMFSVPGLSNKSPGDYRFVLPGTVENDSVEMRVQLSGREIKMPVKFGIPHVDSLSALSGMDGEKITLYGSFINSEQVIGVNFGAVPGIIEYKSNDSINVLIPDVTGGFFSVYLIFGEYRMKVTDNFKILPQLYRMPDLSFASYYAFTMKFGEEVLVATSPAGNTLEKVLYRFDQGSGTFSRLNDITYTLPSGWPAVVTKGSKAYLLASGNGQPEVYMFDRETMEFNKLCDFPGGKYNSQILLDGDSVLYMGGGYFNDYSSEFWKFNYTTGIWTKLKDMPGKSCYSNEFTLNGKCYVVMQDKKMYEYQPASNSWVMRAAYPGYWCRFKVSVECNNKVFMGYGDYIDNILRQYDPLLNSWTEITEAPQSLSMCCINFSLGNRIYIGGSNGSNTFWRF